VTDQLTILTQTGTNIVDDAGRCTHSRIKMFQNFQTITHHNNTAANTIKLKNTEHT